MNVHEVVREAVSEANRNLLTVSRDPAERARKDRQIMQLYGSGLGGNHSALLEPLNGRQVIIDGTVGPYKVELFHPHTPSLKYSRELSGVRFQDETGKEIPPDLCISLRDTGYRDTGFGERSSYIVSEGTVYTLPSPDRAIGNFVSNQGSSGTVVDARRASPTESLAVARIAQQTTSTMLNKLRGVRRDTWRMQDSMDQGVSGDALREKENVLWTSYLDRVKTAPEPSETHPLFPGARRLNYGWEKVVYLMPGGQRVAKVPRGVFPEVNDPAYQKYEQDAYYACNSEIPLFTANTSFERRKGINISYQSLLPGTSVQAIRPEELTSDQRSSYLELGTGMLNMADIHRWMPDLQLERSGDGSWKIWDVMDVRGIPTLYDFTSVFDEFRLDPERTNEEVARQKKMWHSFLENIS